MPDFTFTFSSSLLFLFVGIAASAAVAFLSYQRTVPPLPLFQRWVLGILRFSTLSALVMLLGRPVFTLVSRTALPPVAAVVVDNSISMSLGGSVATPEQVAAITRSDEIRSLEDAGAIRTYVFDSDVREVGDALLDSLRFTGERSDISGVFEQIRRDMKPENLQAVILLTDGNTTTMVPPVYGAQELGVPVFALGIGDTALRKDLVVNDIRTNSLAYAGTRVPVHVVLRSSGFNQERVDITLYASGSAVARSSITLEPGLREYGATMFVTPDSAGMFRGEVRATQFEGELTTKNNQSRFSIRVLSGKRKILLLAGAPGEDVAFLHRALSADSNVTVTSLIEGGAGRFLEGALTESLIREAHALFLVGFPGLSTPPNILQSLQTRAFREKPIFFMLARTTSPEQLRYLDAALPFSMQEFFPQDRQAFVSIPERSRLHPLLRTSREDAWDGLPPVFVPRARFSVPPDASVLATSGQLRNAQQDPFIVSRKVAGTRSVAVLALGLWRWKMLSADGNLSVNVYDEFVDNIVRWLTATDDQRTLRVTPAQETFSALESTVFHAEFYDEGMRPVDDARIELTVRGGDRTHRADFASIGNGQYEATLEALAPGSYAYEAIAQGGMITTARDAGSFEVGDLNAEYLETRLNRDLLRNLAFRTGGAYYDAPHISGIAERVRSNPDWRTRERVSTRQFDLWYDPWVLAFVLGLLTLEWVIRKRLGLL